MAEGKAQLGVGDRFGSLSLAIPIGGQLMRQTIQFLPFTINRDRIGNHKCDGARVCGIGEWHDPACLTAAPDTNLVGCNLGLLLEKLNSCETFIGAIVDGLAPPLASRL